jgi:hypothetical protein
MPPTPEPLDQPPLPPARRDPPTEEEVLAWLDAGDGPEDWYGSDLDLQPEGSAILSRSRPGRPTEPRSRRSPSHATQPQRRLGFTKLGYSWTEVLAAIGALTVFSLVAWWVLRLIE